MIQSQPLQPVIRKRRWFYMLVWILPLLVGGLAFMYGADYLFLQGAQVVVEFGDATGLVPGQSHVAYRGSEIGRVTAVELSQDHKHALVTLKMRQNAAAFASKGASFWIVRPEFSQLGFHGLGTLMTGAYVQAAPGGGGLEVLRFEGLSRPPLPGHEGTDFVLTAAKLGHLQDESPVYYKGIQVGIVRQFELTADASQVHIQIVVWSPYARLVRDNSKFWTSGALDLSGGIFSGFHLAVDSLQSLATGAISFADPEINLGAEAKAGSHFVLEERPQKEWEHWSPSIPEPK
jgi:paraquat-inducible protein B